MFLTRLLSAASLAALLPVAAHAQNTVSLGFGPQIAPGYFGSDTYESGLTANVSVQQLNFGPLRFGGAEGGAASGIGFTGSFRYLGERDGQKYPELAGTTPLDASLEVGAGVTYTADNFYVFGLARYGVTGHESLVGEIGADAIIRPSAPIELRVGPRVFFGSDDYAQNYFGVTAAEAADPRNTLTAYDAEGGMLSRGIEASAAYAFSPDWGVKATVRYDQFTNAAADSPIVTQGSDTSTSASLIVTRRISF